ncbi:MAG: hypothetical protein CMG07_06515 [Candidatus Marinimicrobia bacterium]|nr:hypothetical protein [Candidatus Neomarinimicrobiota bacterium]
MNEFIIFANGHDKIGLVSSLSKKITTSGSNINESRMIKLGDHFAIILSISTLLNQTEIKKILSNQDLTFTIKNKFKKTKQLSEFKFKKFLLKGTDNEGLLYHLTSFFSEHHINIQNLNSNIIQAPITGINLFEIDGEIKIPKNISISFIENQFLKIESKLSVDLKLIDA